MSTSLLAPMDSILNLALMFFQEPFYLRQKMEHMSQILMTNGPNEHIAFHYLLTEVRLYTLMELNIFRMNY